MNRAEKIQITEELKDKFGGADAIFISDFRGLKVNELTSLRFELRKVGSEFKVVKNRMAVRALKPELMDQLSPHFDDMTAVTVTRGDVASSAKILTKFAKINENLKLRAGLVEGKVVSLAEIRALSLLPSRQELLAQLLRAWAAVPTGFVRVLNAVPSGWVSVLDALRREKETKGES